MQLTILSELVAGFTTIKHQEQKKVKDDHTEDEQVEHLKQACNQKIVIKGSSRKLNSKENASTENTAS